MSAAARLKELGLVLPNVPKPVANYVPYRLVGGFLYCSGQGPRDANGALLTGKVPTEVSVDEAYKHARLTGLGLLAVARDALGSLDRVDRFLRVGGVVNATPDFVDHTSVLDAASDVFVQVFGERGEHARLAVGVASLPANIAVEVEATIAVRP